MSSTLQISLLVDPNNNLVPGVNGVITQPLVAAPNVAQTYGLSDKSILVLTPTANMNIKLDNTHLAGRRVVVVNQSSSFTLTVVANDASTIVTVYPLTTAELVPSVDLPAISTSWVSLTPVHSTWLLATLSLVGATNTSAFSNATIANAQYRRSGPNVQVRGAISFTGAPAGGTGAFALLMPGTLLPDTNSVFSSYIVGAADHKVAGVERGTAAVKAINNGGSPMLLSLMAVQFYSALSAAAFAPTVPAVFASGDFISFDLTYPVNGWTVYRG